MTVTIEPDRIVISRAGEDGGGADDDRGLELSYAVENALYQWREGERRIADASEPAQVDLEAAADVVVEELRRRLGSSFLVDELADLYGRDTDWALELARRNAAGTDAASVVDAAFARYVREAKDYAGGRPRGEKP